MSDQKNAVAVRRPVGRPVDPATEIASADWYETEAGDASDLPVLPALKTKLLHEVEQYNLLRREALWRALRVGVLLARAQNALPHGHYKRWIKTHVPLSQMHAWRCLSVAKAYLAKSKMTLHEAQAALFDSRLDGMNPAALLDDPKRAAKLGKPTQLAFEFLHGETFVSVLEQLRMPEPDRRLDGICGHAPLIGWLKKYYPDRKDLRGVKQASDLPPDVRREWDKAWARHKAEQAAGTHESRVVNAWTAAWNGALHALDAGWHKRLTYADLKATEQLCFHMHKRLQELLAERRDRPARAPALPPDGEERKS